MLARCDDSLWSWPWRLVPLSDGQFGMDFLVKFLCCLSLENGVQRKLDTTAHYVKNMLTLEAGSELKIWKLIATIMSAQKHLEDDCIVNPC